MTTVAATASGVASAPSSSTAALSTFKATSLPASEPPRSVQADSAVFASGLPAPSTSNRRAGNPSGAGRSSTCPCLPEKPAAAATVAKSRPVAAQAAAPCPAGGAPSSA